MKPLKWQEDDPVLAEEVRKAGAKNYSPWWDTLMTWVDVVIALFCR